MLRKKSNIKYIEDLNKYRAYYHILNRWIRLKNIGKTTGTFCVNHNYSSVAVYGLGELGCNLCDELLKYGIDVKYGIDRSIKETYLPLKVIDIDGVYDMPKVDAIIISATFYYEDIKKKLTEIIDVPIHSFEEMLEDML